MRRNVTYKIFGNSFFKNATEREKERKKERTKERKKESVKKELNLL